MDSNQKRTGLVLGKFAPLHAGHQYLIERALAQVDVLYVLVYEAKQTTDIDLETRCNWIRTLYPTVNVLVGSNAPEQTGYTDAIKKLQDDYILSMLNGVKITHFFSSEPYGEHVSKALGAQNVIVDLDRTAIPVSATKIRTDPWNNSRFLNPIVRRDVVRKVVFIGGESTGKSTLTAACAKRYRTNMVSEHGREFWDKWHDANGELSSDQLIQLATEHRAKEESAFREGVGLTFVDTNAITTWIYSQHYGRPSAKLDELAEECRTRYHLTILCADDIPFVQDGTRLPEEYRNRFQMQLVWKLTEMNIPFYVVGGSLVGRVEQVKQLVSKHLGLGAPFS